MHNPTRQFLPTVLLVEDQPLTLMGMKVSLQSLGRFDIVGEATDGEEAVREAMRLHPNVILMDVSLPLMDGIEASWKIKNSLPSTKILMFTSHSSADVVAAALGAGAEAYCLKSRSIQEVASAIECVLHGDAWIDPSVADSVVRDQSSATSKNKVRLASIEMRVLDLLRDGMSPQAIAALLKTTPDAIAATMRGIIQAFSHSDRTVTVPEPTPAPVVEEPLRLPAAGDIFAEKYLIESLIGTGGVGSVFKAVHMYMHRVVALKVLHPSKAKDQVILREFVHEAMSIACLEHKNVVGVYDFGVSPKGEPYLVMEFVEGVTLDVILRTEGRLRLPRFKNIFLQVCDALKVAHEKAIVHCDLKPSNILIIQSETGEEVKLADFGLAKMLSQDVEEYQGEEKVVSGTPAFMSPEQCTASKLDQRTDIYSLGCVMFEALTGTKAFVGATPKEIFASHFLRLPPPVSQVITDTLVPLSLESCIAKMMLIDPAERPQSIDEVQSALERLNG